MSGLEDKKEIEDDLYYLYEYTDEVKVVPEHPSFSSMKNYVDLGILTEEEMMEALRYKTKQ